MAGSVVLDYHGNLLSHTTAVRILLARGDAKVIICIFAVVNQKTRQVYKDHYNLYLPSVPFFTNDFCSNSVVILTTSG